MSHRVITQRYDRDVLLRGWGRFMSHRYERSCFMPQRHISGEFEGDVDVVISLGHTDGWRALERRLERRLERPA